MTCIRKLLAACLLIAFASSSSAETFNLFRPASGILVGNPDTFVTTSAAATDVISLWSGDCSPTTFLRGDGSCEIAGSGTVTSIGLTAPSIFAVTGSPITTSGDLALTFATGQPNNQVLATSGGTLGLRALTIGDLPATLVTTDTFQTISAAKTWNAQQTFQTSSGAMLLSGVPGTLGQINIRGNNANGLLNQSYISFLTSGGSSLLGRVGDVSDSDPNVYLWATGNSAAALASDTGDVYLQTDGTPRLLIQQDGTWLVDGQAGTAGQVFTSAGPGAPPTWASAGAGDATLAGNQVFTGVNTFSNALAVTGSFAIEANTNGTLTATLDNDSNGTNASARVAISSGDQNFAMYTAGSGLTSPLVTNGPIGGQAALRTLGSIPIVFGTGNTERMRIDGAGNAVTFYTTPVVESTSPQFQLTDTNAVADRGRMRMVAGSSSVSFQVLSDNAGTINDFITLSTSGVAAPNVLNLQANTVQANGSQICTADGTGCPATGETTATGSATVIGCSTNPGSSSRIVRNGNMAVIRIFSSSCTSNGTGYSFSATGGGLVPVGFRPSTSQECAVTVLNNGNQAPGSIVISSSGAVSVHTGTTGSFAASGTKGIGPNGQASCAYVLN